VKKSLDDMQSKKKKDKSIKDRDDYSQQIIKFLVSPVYLIFKFLVNVPSDKESERWKFFILVDYMEKMGMI
jgi:hypothetical protein